MREDRGTEMIDGEGRDPPTTHISFNHVYSSK